MADSNQSKGFTLPPPKSPVGAPATPAPAGDAPVTSKPLSQAIDTGKILVDGQTAGPQPRDYVIAAAVLLVLLIAFYLAKNAYANHLARQRVSPGASNAAGWWLFIFLAALAIAAVMAVLSPVKFLTPIFMAPLGGISLLALILMFVSGRRS